MIFFKKLKVAHILLTFLFFSFSWQNAHSQTSNLSEAKASWIRTIIDWIDWKNRSDFPTLVCTIGRDKVYANLNKIKRENSDENFVVLNKSPYDDFTECHILYVSNSEQEYYSDILTKTINQNGIVTVSSIRGFARQGGVIEFVIGKKAYPIINLKVAHNSKVTIDSDFSGWAQTIR